MSTRRAPHRARVDGEYGTTCARRIEKKNAAARSRVRRTTIQEKGSGVSGRAVKERSRAAKGAADRRAALRVDRVPRRRGAGEIEGSLIVPGGPDNEILRQRGVIHHTHAADQYDSEFRRGIDGERAGIRLEDDAIQGNAAGD